MSSTDAPRAPRPRNNPPRTREEVRAQRDARNLIAAAGRAVRRRMEANDHIARQESARACGCVISKDFKGEGDYGDGSGYIVTPRAAMRPQEQHAPHVQAVYDAAESARR